MNNAFNPFVGSYEALCCKLGSEQAVDRHVMSQPARIQVLLPDEEAGRFEAYCKEKGFKKSTLIARLIREYLDRERFGLQKELFDPTTTRIGES